MRYMRGNPDRDVLRARTAFQRNRRAEKALAAFPRKKIRKQPLPEHAGAPHPAVTRARARTRMTGGNP